MLTNYFSHLDLNIDTVYHAVTALFTAATGFLPKYVQVSTFYLPLRGNGSSNTPRAFCFELLISPRLS